jgi:hypothetical protein
VLRVEVLAGDEHRILEHVEDVVGQCVLALARHDGQVMERRRARVEAVGCEPVEHEPEQLAAVLQLRRQVRAADARLDWHDAGVLVRNQDELVDADGHRWGRCDGGHQNPGRFTRVPGDEYVGTASL